MRTGDASPQPPRHVFRCLTMLGLSRDTQPCNPGDKGALASPIYSCSRSSFSLTVFPLSCLTPGSSSRRSHPGTYWDVALGEGGSCHPHALRTIWGNGDGVGMRGIGRRKWAPVSEVEGWRKVWASKVWVGFPAAPIWAKSHLLGRAVLCYSSLIQLHNSQPGSGPDFLLGMWVAWRKS